MRGGEGLGGGGDGAERLGFVVGEKNQNRHHAGVGVEQAGRSFDGGNGLGECLRLAREHAPFEGAFIETGVDGLGGGGEADDGLDAGNGADVALELIHERDDVVIDAAVGNRLDDHGEHVDADAKFFGDETTVGVIAGILA